MGVEYGMTKVMEFKSFTYTIFQIKNTHLFAFKNFLEDMDQIISAEIPDTF